jgi:hypothetical protein
MADSVAYWKNVIWQAGNGTCAALGWKDRGQAAIPLMLGAVTALIAYLVVKDRPLSDSIMYPALFGLAAIGVIYVVVFVYHMAITPPRLAVEMQAQITAVTRERTQAINDRPAHDAVLAENSRLKSDNERLTAELTKAQNEQERIHLESVRTAIWKQIEGMPEEANLTMDKSRGWIESSRTMLDTNAPGASHKFQFSGWEYHDLLNAQSSLKTIAGGLKASDLRR